jgi:hypothetical protein
MRHGGLPAGHAVAPPGPVGPDDAREHETRDVVEEKRGRAVVEAEDERQQDQRNGPDAVRVAVEERRDNPHDHGPLRQSPSAYC